MLTLGGSSLLRYKLGSRKIGGVNLQRILIITPALIVLAGCISSSSPAPPARNTTIIVPPGSTAVCSNGTAPPCGR
jgi:hypothetical protein